VVLVVSGEVRGVAAARETIRLLDLDEPLVAVRRPPGPGASSGQIEQALDAEVVCQIPNESRLAELAEQGEPPTHLGRRAWGKAVASLAREVRSRG
jgi:hypothetical protein